MKFRFDEIAFNSTLKKKPVEEDKIHYIGLEHIEPGNFSITEWGSDVAPVGEKLIMKKGDILFGKRRAYQRKVAIAPFDGIFSAHGMVLRPKTDVIDADFFPLFISSDTFMETAMRISVGGLSPTINWKDLKEQEFELPSLEEQQTIAKKAWAAYRLKEAYQRLLVATDEMVKSQFLEMLRECSETKPLSDVSESIVKGITPKYVDSSDVEVINQACINWDTIDFSKVKYHNNEYPYSKGLLKAGDVLLTMTGRGTLGKCNIFIPQNADTTYIADGHLSVIRLSDAKLLPEIFTSYIALADTQNEIYRNYVTGSTNQLDIVFSKIQQLPIPSPSVEAQKTYVGMVRQADKSKFELKRAIEAVDKVIKSLING